MNRPITCLETTVGSLKLVAKTGLTGLTDSQVQIEVFDGNTLIHSDRVNLGIGKQRDDLVKKVLAQASNSDGKELGKALLDFQQKLPTKVPAPRSSPATYRETPQGLVWEKPTNNGTAPTPLTNFKARIVGDILEDDGAFEHRYYQIEAECAGRSKRFDVSAKDFPRMNWPAEQLGPKAIVHAGYSTRDHARVGIQTLSNNIVQRRVYAHIGWTHCDGKWIYLHADGGIGEGSNGTEVNVRDERLRNYILPPSPKNKTIQFNGSQTSLISQVVRRSSDLLTVAPPYITIPLLAATYRAPLAAIIPVEFSLFLEGQTGSQKTELTAQAQAHFGRAFSRTNLPGNWETTENALEKQAFLAKDAVFVVDDFAPKGSQAEVSSLHTKADRLLRGQGNQRGRGRMTADTTLQPEYWPRGLIITSGEDLPRGQSLRARTVVLEVKRGDVDLARLTKVQDCARHGFFALAMAGYIDWLAPQMDALKSTLPKHQEELRNEAKSSRTFQHDRTPDNVASLALGWEMLLRYAVEVGTILEREREKLRQAGWKALLGVGSRQAGEQATQDEVDRFVTLLAAVLVSGRGHLANAKNSDTPPDPQRWGWRKNGADWFPLGQRIGWIDGQDIYLQPDTSFALVRRLAQEQSQTLATTDMTLRRRLDQKGLLASRDSDQLTVRKTIDGRQQRVLHLHASTLSG